MAAARLVFAVVFAAAVLGKVRYFTQFVEYLRPVFGRHSRPSAVAVLTVEGCVAVTLPFTAVAHISGIVAIAFLIVATAFIAVRLSVDAQTACACWGAATPPLQSDLGYADMLRPAWYGLRNGMLCLAIWLVTQASGSVAAGWGFLCACLGCIVAGLMASIAHERKKLTLPEHPKRDEFAPYLAPLIALSWYSGPGL